MKGGGGDPNFKSTLLKVRYSKDFLPPNAPVLECPLQSPPYIVSSAMSEQR